LPTFGEAWHNDHHAFRRPRAMGSGAGRSTPRRGQPRALEAAGLAWEVVRVAPDRQARKAVGTQLR
jgi:fatty-acid desaturase